MKYLLGIKSICLLLFISANTFAQNAYFQVRSVKYTDDGRNLHFPIMIGDSAKSTTAEKINQYLQLSELELLNGSQLKTIFEKVAEGNSGLYGNKFDIVYSIYTNNNKILSMGFDESASGMTTHYWTTYYNYNSGNGDVIHPSDLFTKTGYQQFHKYVVKKGVHHFKKQLGQSMKTDTSSLRVETEKDIIENLEKFITDDFYIKNNSIIFDSENCLNKGEQGTYNMTIKLTLPEFKIWLNDYGKCVFGIKKDNITQYRSGSLPQLFTGKIDKYPILFIIRKDYDNEYSGIYCYKKFGKGIYITGSITNGRVKLDEKDEHFENSALISGNFDRDSIVGTWAKTTGGTRVPLAVYRK